MEGTSSFPADGSGTRLNLDGSKILDNLKLFAMGTAGAHNGTWGVFTDVVSLKFRPRVGEPGLHDRQRRAARSTSAAFDWEMKGTAWTLAGEAYRIASAPSYTVDVLAGMRLLDTRQHLRWNIGGSIGSLDPAARSGEVQTSQSTWDAIVGFKGRYAFGSTREWAVPFYFDAGAGESKHTLRHSGLAYQFGWGEVSAMWRYLRYEAKSGADLQDVSFSGPLIAATFRW